MKSHVTIIGGGLAGLSTAVFLNENGFKIKIIESSPKWGGRAYSIYDKNLNLYYDNGQHILAGWYKNTFKYLKLIDSFKLFDFQKSFSISFLQKNRKFVKLICPSSFGKYNLIAGLIKFPLLNLHDRLKLLKIRKVFGLNVKDKSAEDIFNELEQTDNLKKYFWNPFILSVFNTSPCDVSAEVFVNLLIIGLEKPENLSLVFPKYDLNRVFIDNTKKYFEKNNIKYLSSTRVKNLNIENDLIVSADIENGTTEFADLFVSAVPAHNFRNLFDRSNYNNYFDDFDELKYSAITSLHLFFDTDLNIDILGLSDYGMLGFADSFLQWIFIKSKRHIVFVLSGSDLIENNLTEAGNEIIFEKCIRELFLFNRDFSKFKIKDYKIIRERKATFIPDNNFAKYRLNNGCGIKNLFIAGDWTNTGLPSTIESAVTSGKNCSEIITKLYS